MFRKLNCIVILGLLLCWGLDLQAQEEFSLLPTFDTSVGNDAQIGPDSADNGSGMAARNVPTRRRVAFATYDISEIKVPGLLFSNVSLSNYGHDGGPVNVYGIIESQEMLVGPGLNWNNAPGVENTPTPELDTDVVLDPNDITEILLTFDAPARGVRESTDTSEALADFLNQDTNGFIALMFAPEGAGNAIVRTIEKTDPGEEGGTRIEGTIGGASEFALSPIPSDGDPDVFRDQDLGWQPGVFAATHDVYLGTDYNDVNDANRVAPLDVLVAQDHDVNSFNPGRLIMGQTYYWKINEVNGAPDFFIYPGTVWSFTVEPECYLIDVNNITVTATSQSPGDFGPENTNGPGLTGDQHSSTIGMWLSAQLPADSNEITYLQYEFDRVYPLAAMEVWNFNLTTEMLLGWGAKDVEVAYSLDGQDWTLIDGITQFTQAQGVEGIEPTDTFALDVDARYVRITIKSHWGVGSGLYGLSEVRFCSIPTAASFPDPASGSTANPDSLSWRPGREADQHQVYGSSDEDAVINESAQGVTVSEPTVDAAGFELILGQTFYWKVNEMNDTEDPSVWPGEVWNFTLPEFIVVDDFESYGDGVDPGPPPPPGNRIWYTWKDGEGWNNPSPVEGNGSGSVTNPPNTETVHGGAQSLELSYANDGDNIFGSAKAFYSEVVADTSELPIGSDWTIHGATTLSLWFYGDPTNAAGATEQLYVRLNNVRIPYDGPLTDIQEAEWHEWVIDLTGTGVDLGHVTMLGVGIGDPANTTAGGSGLVQFDDFRLYATPPAPEN